MASSSQQLTNGHHTNGHTTNGHTINGEIKSMNGVKNGNIDIDPIAELKSNPKTVVEGFVNVPESDSNAYLRNYKTHSTGISHEAMVAAYSEWANNYDEDLCPGRYNGPEIAASAMAAYYATLEQRANLRVLDVAAGTGRVGHELHKLGFRHIDALEPSAGMLQVLVGRGIYGRTYQSPIGYEQIAEIPANSYEALVIAGGMGEGHIPVTAFHEMIRIVGSGGTIWIIMREEYLSYVKEYVDKLEPTMKALEEQGKWKMLSRNIVPQYSFNKNGLVYNFQVL